MAVAFTSRPNSRSLTGTRLSVSLFQVVLSPRINGLCIVPVMMSSAADHHRRSGFLVWLRRLLPGFYPPVADCWCRRGVCTHKHTRRLAHRVGRVTADASSQAFPLGPSQKALRPTKLTPVPVVAARPSAVPQSLVSQLCTQVRQATKAPAATSGPGPSLSPTRTRATTSTASTRVPAAI